MKTLESPNSSLTTDLHVEATYRLTEELVAAQQRMQRRVHLLSEIVFETDADGRLVFLNDAWRHSLELELSASIGQPLQNFVHPEDQASLDALLRTKPTTAEPVRPCLRFRHSHGDDVWMEISVSFLADGGTVGAMRNVTRQRQAQAEIEKLSLVASSTDNLVIITDGEGRIEWVNQAFILRTEYQLHEVIGRKPGEFLQGPDTDRETVQRISACLKEGRSFQAELVNYSKSGTPYWTSFQVNPIRNQSGAVERYIAIQTDSTERRKTQLELELARQRAEAASLAKTQFLANVSHEMRTPLNAVLGYSDLATEENLSSAEVASYLGKVREGADLLLRLITDLLDVSNLEASQIDVEQGPFHLHTCVEAALEGMRQTAASNGLAFVLDYDPALPAEVNSDPRRLAKILHNLTENAIKFTEAGEVRVSLSTTTDPGSGGPRLQINVSDTGIGISAEAQQRVFESFERIDTSTTRKRGGMGLGLTMVKALVDALGGSISLQSQLGVGSQFTVLLPLRTVDPVPSDQPSQTVTKTSATLHRRTRSPRILIAEDTDPNFLILRKMLSSTHVQIERATTGNMAVDLAAKTRFDLILMDIEMPGMDGLQAARLIRDHEREMGLLPVPLLAFTAYATKSSRDSCSAAGCTGFLTKPIRKQELLEAVGQAIAQPLPSTPANPKKNSADTHFVSVDPELLEFVPDFMQHCRHQLDNLRQSIAQHDAARAARIGHDLKGCAPGLGFDALGRMGVAIETAAKGEAFSELQACADQAEEYLTTVRYA